MAIVDREELLKLSKNDLIDLILNQREELYQRKRSARELRDKLVISKKKINSLRETVAFQRKRIIEFYQNQHTPTL